MQKRKLFIALAIAACSTAAMADDEINYSLNLKSWNHKLKDSGTNSGNVNATVVSGTARKGRYFLTASMLLPTTYYFGEGSYLDRRDADIAVGWSATSNISLLGGYKQISTNNYDFSGTSSDLAVSKFDVTYIGLNGFESIGEKTFVFGTLTRSLDNTKTKDGVKTTGLTFTTYEAGLGYVLNKETQLTFGYRNQAMKNDTTVTLSGFIFGANFSY